MSTMLLKIDTPEGRRLAPGAHEPSRCPADLCYVTPSIGWRDVKLDTSPTEHVFEHLANTHFGHREHADEPLLPHHGQDL